MSEIHRQVNMVYTGVSLFIFAVLILSYRSKKSVVFMIPLGTILMMRQVIRIADFEQTKTQFGKQDHDESQFTLDEWGMVIIGNGIGSFMLFILKHQSFMNFKYVPLLSVLELLCCAAALSQSF